MSTSATLLRSEGKRLPTRRRLWRYHNAAIGAASVLALLVLWQIVATFFYSEVFLPTPVEVFAALWQQTRDLSIFPQIGASLTRILGGFLLGCLVGVPLGLLMGAFATMRAVFLPHLRFFRSLPPLALLTPITLWFGIGEASKWVIIFYTTVAVVILSSMIGASSVAENKLQAARSLGANRTQVFRHVIVPAAIPHAISGMRLAMGNSFATVVSAEIIAANSGLGFLIWNARLFDDTPSMFVGIILLGMFGLLADRAFVLISRRFGHRYGLSSA